MLETEKHKKCFQCFNAFVNRTFFAGQNLLVDIFAFRFVYKLKISFNT